MSITNCTIGERVFLDRNWNSPSSRWIITREIERTIYPECNETLALHIEEDRTVVLSNRNNATKFIVALASPLGSLV